MSLIEVKKVKDNNSMITNFISGKLNQLNKSIVDKYRTIMDTEFDNLKQFVNVYDLRENKNRYDDIVITIDKSNM
jgi:hypothetical protein